MLIVKIRFGLYDRGGFFCVLNFEIVRRLGQVYFIMNAQIKTCSQTTGVGAIGRSRTPPLRRLDGRNA